MSCAFVKSLRLLLVGLLGLVRLCVSREVRAEIEAPPKPWQVAGIRAAFGDVREPVVEPSLNVAREALKICANRGWGAALDAQEVAVSPFFSGRAPYGRRRRPFWHKWGKMADASRSRVEPLLKDCDREVRFVAIRALGMMGQEGADFGSELAGLMRSLEDVATAEAAMYVLGQLGKEGFPVGQDVAPFLNDENPTIRLYAAMTLSEMSAEGSRFAKEVATLLKDKEYEVRQTAAVAFGSGMGKAGAAYARELTILLRNDFEVRGFAAEYGLIQMAKDGVLAGKEVTPLLQDPDPIVRESAATILAQMDEKGAVIGEDLSPSLKKEGGGGWRENHFLAQEDHDGNVRVAAAASLRGMVKKRETFAGYFAPLLKDEDAGVRSTAIFEIE